MPYTADGRPYSYADDRAGDTETTIDVGYLLSTAESMVRHIREEHPAFRPIEAGVAFAMAAGMCAFSGRETEDDVEAITQHAAEGMRDAFFLGLTTIIKRYRDGGQNTEQE